MTPSVPPSSVPPPTAARPTVVPSEPVLSIRDLSVALPAGGDRAHAVRGLSLGFITRKAQARAGGGRTIKSLELLEASLVTIPMHADAKVVSAKSAVQALQLAAAINRAAAQIGRN